MFWLSLSAMLDFSNSHKILLRKKLKRGVFSPVMHKYTKWKQRRWYLCRVYEILVNIWACVFNKSWKHPWFVIKPLWGRQRGLMSSSKSLFDNAIKALSFCQMGLMEKWINIRAEVHIYASYEMAKFIPWPPDKRRASFFHIVNWFKNLLIRLFTVAWHWVTLGDIRWQ